nr:MAG TPA: hypothetical protein [Bacteriophage sp.]
MPLRVIRVVIYYALYLFLLMLNTLSTRRG